VTDANREALRRIASGGSAKDAGVDDLTELLLQISLALMMVFMIAFFVFRVQTETAHEEEKMALNRQKLILAADRVEQAYRTRYGLPGLMRTGGKFNPDDVFPNGTFTDQPVVREAFCACVKEAGADYADTEELRGNWRAQTLEAAQVPVEKLSEEDIAWLDDRIARGLASARSDVRRVQRACAARIQCAWFDGRLSGEAGVDDLVAQLKGKSEAERLRLATEISLTLKTRSLARIAELTGGEVLP